MHAEQFMFVCQILRKHYTNLKCIFKDLVYHYYTGYNAFSHNTFVYFLIIIGNIPYKKCIILRITFYTRIKKMT